MKQPKSPGIYAIRHVDSDFAYIGSSRVINHRWRTHKSELRRGCHHCPHLQHAWTKHGESAFVFEVLETCLNDPVILYHREQVWLERAQGRLYNATFSSEPGTSRRVTDEERRRSSERMKGNKNGLGKSFCGVLTESDVVTILHRFAKGDRIAEIAASFGVHGHTVRRISKRITWPDVQVDPVVEKARALRAATKDTGKYGTRIKVGQEKAEEIRRQFNLGRPIAAIAQEFGISVNNVRSAVTTSWKPRPGADLASLIADPVEPPRIKPLEKGYRIRRPAQPRRPRVQKTGVRCDACGMEMLRNPCDILRSKRFYCSVDCRNTKASDRVIEAQAKPEIRARMSASQKARMANPANRARLAAANLGKKASLETRSKMSASHIARLAERRAAKLRSRATKATM